MAIPGPGFLATFAGAPRSNADWDRAEAHRRTPSFVDEAGRSHPNRGAISPWNRVTLRTTKPISAGSEIVVHYDDPLLAGQSSSSSADDDNENDADEHAVTSEDYRKIDETIQQMLQFFDKHAANLDDGARDQIYRFLVQDFMEAAVGPIKARRVAELFPPGPQELVHVPLVGGIKNYSNDTSRVQLHRVEWLQSSGYCYDQVRKRCFGSSFVFVPFVPGALLSHNRCYLFQSGKTTRRVWRAPPSAGNSSKKLRVGAPRIHHGLPPRIFGCVLEPQCDAQRCIAVGVRIASRTSQCRLGASVTTRPCPVRTILHCRTPHGSCGTPRH